VWEERGVALRIALKIFFPKSCGDDADERGLEMICVSSGRIPVGIPLDAVAMGSTGLRDYAAMS